jgi:hypothetical protein
MTRARESDAGSGDRRVDHASDHVRLVMATYKPLAAQAHAFDLLSVFEQAGGIYLPEYVGCKWRYGPHQWQRIAKHWTAGELRLTRRRPVEVEVHVVIWPPGCQLTLLGVSIDTTYFDPPSRLDEVIGLGNALYGLLLPYAGYVELPWMPRMKAIAQPQWGLPGWGWASWLGPEYEPIIELPAIDGVSVHAMADGGRLFVLPFPRDTRVPDAACIGAHEAVLAHADPLAFQPVYPELPELPPIEMIGGVPEASRAAEAFIQQILPEIVRRSHSKTGVRIPRFRFQDDR